VANAIKAVDGQTATVTYKSGEKKIDLPANVLAELNAEPRPEP
jgi:hypothetical protein